METDVKKILAKKLTIYTKTIPNFYPIILKFRDSDQLLASRYLGKKIPRN